MSSLTIEQSSSYFISNTNKVTEPLESRGGIHSRSDFRGQSLAMNVQQGEVSSPSPFFVDRHALRSSSIEEAVEKIRKGEKPFLFVSVLSEEEKIFLDGLTYRELVSAFENHKIQHLGRVSNEERLDSENVEKATKILSRVMNQLDQNKITSCQLAIASNSPDWHIDGSWSPSLSKPEGLRVTIAFKGSTSQFFYSTKSEYDEFLANDRDSRTAMKKITEITEANPERVLEGDRYDISVFNTATIHRGPKIYENRLLYTVNGDRIETDPIALLHT